MPEIRRIAALGSSFAAGPTIQPVADAAAMRSERNYAHLLADALGAELVDLTVSGATTANILDTPQATTAGPVFPPQVDGVPADADVVTITAGGNDLQMVGSMLFLAWQAFDPGGQMASLLGADLAGGVPVASDDDVAAVAGGLVRVVEAARRQAPGARVVLVDYLTIVGDSTVQDDDSPFDGAERTALQALQAALGRAYALAATRSGAELLTMSSLSRGHGLGSDDPWVFGFRSALQSTAGSFHPNEAGMAAVADHLVSLLGS